MDTIKEYLSSHLLMESFFSKIEEHYWLKKMVAFLAMFLITPVYLIKYFHYIISYYCIYLGSITTGRKVIIFSFSHIMEFRFVNGLMAKLDQNDKIKIVLVCGHRRLNPNILRKYCNKYPIFPYGILPCIKASAFVSLKVDLIWHQPLFTKKILVFYCPNSIHMIWLEGAFDSYNVYFAIGPHHTNELREFLPKRGKKNFKIYNIGCESIDLMINDRKYSKGIKRIIYAPTWGKGSSLRSYGKDVLEKLLLLNFEVVFRPHPMSLACEKECIKDILLSIKKYDNFFYDNRDVANIIDNSVDLMISDWSGASLEFALGYDKPVIFIDTPQKINNRRWSRYISNRGVEYEYREKLGCILRKLEELPILINDIDTHYDNYVRRIRNVSCELLYNPGKSSSAAYNAILDILN